MLRFLGLVCLLTVFLASGYNKVTAPKEQAVYLSKSNFGVIFSAVAKQIGISYKLTPADYVLLVQVAGTVFISFSLFILLGVGRSFFSILLALGLAFITVCFHVNIANPAATPVPEIIQVLKNLSIFGGLLYVAAGRKTVVKVSEKKKQQ